MLGGSTQLQVCAALPVWISLAEPFSSVRWYRSGVYDSLIYLGTGLVASLMFWWVTVRAERRLSAPGR